METWKQVPGWTAYEVSDLGRVRRAGKAKGAVAGRIKSPTPRGGGYARVILHQDGMARQVDVHILVAEAFLGPRPTPDHQAAHEDGQPWNCCLSNILWKTRSENDADKDRHGTRPRGESHRMSKLSDDDVREIRATVGPRGIYAALARKFSVSPSTISKIKLGRKWTHV